MERSVYQKLTLTCHVVIVEVEADRSMRVGDLQFCNRCDGNRTIKKAGAITHVRPPVRGARWW